MEVAGGSGCPSIPCARYAETRTQASLDARLAPSPPPCEDGAGDGGLFAAALSASACSCSRSERQCSSRPDSSLTLLRTPMSATTG